MAIKPKYKKKSNIANSIKTLKMIHIQEKKKSKKKKRLYKIHSKEDNLENSLAVRWVGLHSFTAKGAGSILGRGTKVPQAKGHGEKKIFFFKRRRPFFNLKYIEATQTANKVLLTRRILSFVSLNT